MKVSELLRQAQAGTVDGQVQLLGDFVTNEVSKLFVALGGEAGDQKMYIQKADFRAWKNATERVFQDLKNFTSSEKIGSKPLPAGYKVDVPPG